MLRLVGLLVLIWGATAIAAPPRGYKCGEGKKLAGKGCTCPAGQVEARDQASFAICIPEPAATACLADRKGEEVIKIDSAPDAAAIYIGAKACGIVGYTPWTGKLAAGPVIVILERTSFEPVTRTLMASPRASQALYVPLVRTNAGSLDIRADADPNVVGAAITVDNQPRGVVPAVVQVAGGRHQIAITKLGYEPYAQWVDVADSQIVALLPVLKQTASRLGKLVVDADVPDVELYLDEVKQAGTTPFVASVPAGAHVVEVRKAGATPWRQTVVVRANDQTLVHAELAKSMQHDPLRAAIKVTSAVPGGELFVDGTSLGKLPLEAPLAAGDHWLVVKLAKHQTFEQKLRLDPGQLLAIVAELPPTAELHVLSSPAGAAVFVDKIRAGITPLQLELVLGAHVVWIERAGYQRHEERVTLSGPTLTLSIQLKP